jgi:hypothetical protein
MLDVGFWILDPGFWFPFRGGSEGDPGGTCLHFGGLEAGAGPPEPGPRGSDPGALRARSLSRDAEPGLGGGDGRGVGSGLAVGFYPKVSGL